MFRHPVNRPECEAPQWPQAPQPRLGAGLYDAHAPGSGWLTPQGIVEFNGRRGLFDDVFGVRFALVARDQAVLDTLSHANRLALQELGAIVTHIGAGGFVDVQGVYADYLAKHAALAMLVRPDFYSFGTARDAQTLDALVDAWRVTMQPVFRA